ncbi:MAG: cryptochrome/photolyase family protein [Candidatus Methylacidiphilales bacterium]
MEYTLVFPHQLFHRHPAIKKNRPIILVEDSLFFGDPHHPAHFHIQKIIFHRATMRAYAEQLRHLGYSVEYWEYLPGSTVDKQLKKRGLKKEAHLHFTDPTDHILARRLKRFAEQHHATLHVYENPSFLTPKGWNETYFASRKQRFMARYYQDQRLRLGILLTPDGKPEGGKWSFDEDNRKAVPKGHRFPEEQPCENNQEIMEARSWAKKKFTHAPGNQDSFRYAIDRHSALQRLDDFLEHRFALFGDYEDAIQTGQTQLYHSILTPYLNVGLITPQEVVDRTLAYAASHHIPLNSLEGFIRQIIGWREFMRAMYELHGVEMRKRNYWNFTRGLPASFYTGTTGIEPIDHTIRRVLDGAYCHHIERLMVLGNFMLLCRIDPDDVYRWFMEMFIDAYDWVMVPNVYGMSQFADGGTFTTKPYLSSSNYIRKMSNYRAGDWCAVWDGLFWSFIGDHSAFFRSQPRLSMMSRQWEKMPVSKRDEHHKAARTFLAKLDQKP